MRVRIVFSWWPGVLQLISLASVCTVALICRCEWASHMNISEECIPCHTYIKHKTIIKHNCTRVVPNVSLQELLLKEQHLFGHNTMYTVFQDGHLFFHSHYDIGILSKHRASFFVVFLCLSHKMCCSGHRVTVSLLFQHHRHFEICRHHAHGAGKRWKSLGAR